MDQPHISIYVIIAVAVGLVVLGFAVILQESHLLASRVFMWVGLAVITFSMCAAIGEKLQ